VVTGDDVLAAVREADPVVIETGQPVSAGEPLVSANAYLGAGGIADALGQGADLVITGRVADPSLYVGPLRHEFGWAADGTATFGKLPGSDGRLDLRTCGEQLLYEVDDPAAYLTPDVTADFSGVRFRQLGPDRVRASGAAGRPRPEQLKVTLGYRGGWLGEGQIS
jgi:hypothetical protein